MNTTEAVKTLLGDDISPFIASEIKESYEDLKTELENIENNVNRTPIFSYNKEEEINEIKKFIEAMKITHSWFSNNVI